MTSEIKVFKWKSTPTTLLINLHTPKTFNQYKEVKK